MNWFQWFLENISYLITAGIAVFSIWSNLKMKDLELRDKKGGRVFEFKKTLMLKSIDAMAEASFRLGRQAEQFAIFVAENKIEYKTEVFSLMKEDLEFITRNKPYFFPSLREGIHSVSSNLTHIIRNYEAVDHKLKLDVFAKALPTVRNCKKSIEEMLDSYNVFEILEPN